MRKLSLSFLFFSEQWRRPARLQPLGSVQQSGLIRDAVDWEAVSMSWEADMSEPNIIQRRAYYRWQDEAVQGTTLSTFFPIPSTVTRDLQSNGLLIGMLLVSSSGLVEGVEVLYYYGFHLSSSFLM